MAKNDREDLDDHTIAGRAVADWDKSWQHVPYGFTKLQSNLRTAIGLFAAKQGDCVMYIGAAVQMHAGFRAGLARVRLREQTGNSSHGMKAVRKAGDSVEAYIIRMPPSVSREEISALKWALIDLHKPPMNAPRDIVTAARKANYAKRSS